MQTVQWGDTRSPAEDLTARTCWKCGKHCTHLFPEVSPHWCKEQSSLLNYGPQRKEAGEREQNTCYSGKVLDKSIRAEIFMRVCLLSPGLTQCRSLPSQASTEALLMNLLKCRFSNIIMTEHCCLLMEKINCYHLWRATARWEQRKDGGSSLAQWGSKGEEGADLEQGKDFWSSHH